jgi:hypothetical protein
MAPLQLTKWFREIPKIIPKRLAKKIPQGESGKLEVLEMRVTPRGLTQSRMTILCTMRVFLTFKKRLTLESETNSKEY